MIENLHFKAISNSITKLIKWFNNSIQEITNTIHCKILYISIKHLMDTKYYFN